MAGRKHESYRMPPPLAWGAVPLVPLAGAVMLGIGLAYGAGYRFGPWFLFLALAPALCALLLQWRGGVGYAHSRVVSGLLLLSVVFLSGWRAADAHFPNDPAFFAEAFHESDLLTGTVTHIKGGEKRLQLWTTVDGRVDTTNTLHRAVGKIIAFVEPDGRSEAVRVGDRLVLNTRIRPAPSALNPEAFDYAAYLAAHDVFHLAYPRGEGEYRVISRSATGLRELAERCRRAWQDILATYLAGDELAVASALVLGKRDDLSPEIRQAYADTGAVHVLAVSGLHVGIVTAIFFWLFRALLPRRRWAEGVRTVATIAVVWAFAFVTGLSPSVQRSALMFSLLVVGQWGHRRVATLNLLALAAIAMLLWQPGQLFQVSFQLSFAAVTGIVLFAAYLNRLLPHTGRAHWLVSRIWATLSASVGAQLGTFPLAAMYFRQFPAYFLASGTVVVLTAFLILSLGIALGGVVAVFGPNPLATLLAELLNAVLVVQNELVRFFQGLAGARVRIGGMSWWVVGGYVGLIGLLAILVRWRRPAYAFAALGALAVLGPLRTLERHLFPPVDELVIYHIYGSSAVDVFSRGKVYAHDFGAADERARTVGEDYRRARRVGAVDSLVSEGRAEGELPRYLPPFLLTSGGTVLVLDGEEAPLPTANLPDISLIWIRAEYPTKEVATFVEQSDVPVVVDGSNRSFYVRRLREVVATERLHVTAEEGAYCRPAFRGN